MKKKAAASKPMQKWVRDALETIQIKLHDLDEKLNYLIRNLRRCNGYHDPHHTPLSDYLD